MFQLEPIIVTWHSRVEPLRPKAVVARGDVAVGLGRRLLTHGHMLALKGVVFDDTLIVLGDSDDLPWYDGVSYLGSDTDAPLILTPTTKAPSIPIDLFARALRQRYGSAPLAVLPFESMVVSIADADILDRKRLQEWLDDLESR